MKLRKAAKGRACMVRIPYICNRDESTVVLAHYRLGGLCGTGLKPDDAIAAWACSACHDAIDGRSQTPYTRDELRLMHADGMARTFDVLRKEGFL